MLILIPVEGTDEKLAKITTVAGLKSWAVVDFDEGEVQSVTFHDDRIETGYDFIDFVILENKFENYLDFMEEGMMVLVRREEETIEELIEAFKFKELDEAGI
jgi:predicted Fe-Mo cluster-binding NifX family protein